eukprot:9242088-Pyramimonas_sp.AAC.1
MPYIPINSFSIVSWNSHCLFTAVGGGGPRASRRYSQLLKLATRHSVVCVQATHGHLGDIEELQSQLR